MEDLEDLLDRMTDTMTGMNTEDPLDRMTRTMIEMTKTMIDQMIRVKMMKNIKQD